ncbi:MAG TPA: MFS transporter [Candidatus Dormibacteraeota bacterium]|nr:MFS transporter [Candidatus Dormibacteraeota bacterium]
MQHRRTLWTLYAINFLTQLGAWFFVPLLPIYMSRRGGSATLVGVVLAAGLVSNVLMRYPAGWLADRIGTKPVLVGAMAANAALFLAYLLPVPVTALILIRLLHGAAQGSYWPAANGLIAEVTVQGERGRAFGYMQASNMAGMLIGPAIGGFVALFDLAVVFGVASVLSTVAVVALTTLPNVRAAATVQVPARALHIARTLLPLLLLGAGTAWMIGVFDTTWSLYLTYRGASTFAVGLSFAAFALPAMLISGYAGTLGDRFGPRRFVVVAVLFTALFAAIYPFVSSVPWLVGLGLIEGIFTISGMPSLMAEVSRVSGPGQFARTQAVFQTVGTTIQIVATLVGGALFSLSPTYSYLSITVVCLLSAATALLPRSAILKLAEQP